MPEKQHQVFISYSSIDKEIAFELLHVLEGSGLRCWIAPRDIPQGAQWAEEIDRAIQQARAFVVIISSNSIESKQVPKEVALAVSACEGIFPFRIDNTDLRGGFRYYLSDYQFVDAVQQTKNKMEELATSIRSSLGLPAQTPTAEKPAGPDKTASEPAPSVHPAPEKTPSGGKQTRGKKGLLLGLGALALLALVLVLVLTLGDKPAAPAEDAAQLAGTEADAQVSPTAPSETAAAAEPSESSSEAQANSSVSVPEPTADASTLPTVSSYIPLGQQEDDTAIHPLFGGWVQVKAEHRGAWLSLGLNGNALGSFVVNPDGFVYDTGDDYLQWTQQPELQRFLRWTGSDFNFTEVFTPISDADAYTLKAVCFLMDSFDGSVPTEEGDITAPTLHTPDPASMDLTDGVKISTRYLAVHITGSYRESPVSVLPVDSWYVLSQSADILYSQALYLTFVGSWTDNLGNRWDYQPSEEKLAFTLTTPDGTVYTGKSMQREYHSAEKMVTVDFFFDGFNMLGNLVVYYDGALLYLIDANGAPFYLMREA